jgi:hypothetical protein
MSSQFDGNVPNCIYSVQPVIQDEDAAVGCDITKVYSMVGRREIYWKILQSELSTCLSETKELPLRTVPGCSCDTPGTLGTRLGTDYN